MLSPSLSNEDRGRGRTHQKIEDDSQRVDRTSDYLLELAQTGWTWDDPHVQTTPCRLDGIEHERWDELSDVEPIEGGGEINDEAGEEEGHVEEVEVDLVLVRNEVFYSKDL